MYLSFPALKDGAYRCLWSSEQVPVGHGACWLRTRRNQGPHLTANARYVFSQELPSCSLEGSFGPFRATRETRGSPCAPMTLAVGKLAVGVEEVQLTSGCTTKKLSRLQLEQSTFRWQSSGVPG